MLYKKHAAKAGIKIEVIIDPDDGYWSKVWMKKPWVMCYWSGRATADWMFSTAYAEGSAWNDTFWKHERFNKLLKEARAELNELPIILRLQTKSLDSKIRQATGRWMVTELQSVGGLSPNNQR
jgi:ABC-type transport system substrate-binding protein